jgi:hypothetical protein
VSVRVYAALQELLPQWWVLLTVPDELIMSEIVEGPDAGWRASSPSIPQS